MKTPRPHSRAADRAPGLALGVAAVIGACLLFSSCGGGGGGAGPENPAAPGWTLFEDGNYTAARDSFLVALAADSTATEVWSGLGWCLARLDFRESAIAHFTACLALQPASPVAEEAQAGRAAAALGTEPAQAELALASAEAALAASPRFVFRYDSGVDWQDLHLIIAEASYALSDYDRALAEVDSLGGTRPDPGSPTFLAELLAELQRLADLLH